MTHWMFSVIMYLFCDYLSIFTLKTVMLACNPMVPSDCWTVSLPPNKRASRAGYFPSSCTLCASGKHCSLLDIDYCACRHWDVNAETIYNAALGGGFYFGRGVACFLIICGLHFVGLSCLVHHYVLFKIPNMHINKVHVYNGLYCIWPI